MVATTRARVREPAGNLPADVTSFVGRRHEITLTKRLLAESRVVTLTGPGGVGKTRLALRVASNMRRGFRDKSWIVQLEELSDGSLVADAVIEQLGLGGPSTAGNIDAIIEHLKTRDTLLVLDNCEHVVEDVALLVDTVLRRCPGVRVLATSRQSLGVAGESTMVVPPLQVPDIEHLPPPESCEQFASVRLFVDRARAVVPEFTADAERGEALMRLAYHLDGNPLAIELAAVRLRSLSLHQLEERLSETYGLLTEGRRGAPARQRTVRALIDWSYELCSDREKLAWARFSVFSGSFDLEAAEHVAADGITPAQVLGSIHSLVDKSVLLREEHNGEVRFRLMHLLREYGQEKLNGFGEKQHMRQRHEEWYADLVRRFAPEWIGDDQVAWVHRLRKDQGNLRLALHTAIASSETAPSALRMVVRLAQYWTIRGLNGEARYWLNQALAAAPTDVPERVPALRVNAWFTLLQGDFHAAVPLLDEAEHLAKQWDFADELAYLSQVRGMGAFFHGDLDRARRLLEDALARFRARSALFGELFALFGLGMVASLSGRHEAGVAYLDECIRRTADRGELFWRSYALWASAHIELRRGVIERAEAAAKAALRLQRQLDNRLATAFSLDTLACIAQRQGRNERAARLFGAAAALWDAVRAAPGFYKPFKSDHDEHVALAREALGENAYENAFERGYRLTPAHAVDYALEVRRHARGVSDDEVPLTRREREIADLVAKGHTNKEIAESLVIAQRTVEGHVQNILTKLDFTSRAQVAGWIAAQQAENPGDTASHRTHPQ